MNKAIFENTKNIDLVVVIPTLNEEQSIKKIILDTKSALSEFPDSWKLVVSDNGSTDKTLKILNEFSDILINGIKEKGYGQNLIGSFKSINSKFIIFYDADGSYDPKNIVPMYKQIKDNNLDLVYLNRLKKQEKNAMPFINKYFGTPILTSLINTFYKGNITDCNSGMRIFRNDKIKKIQFISKGMEFASELFIEGLNNKLKIDQHISVFKKDTRTHAPHLNRWKDGWRHLKIILSFLPLRVLNIILCLILFNYFLSFTLTFFKTTVSGFPRIHSIILLLSINIFLQILCLIIFNNRLKFKEKFSDLEKFNLYIQMYKRSYFIISSAIMISIFILLNIYLIISWIKSEEFFLNLEIILRIIMFANITSFLIHLEMIMDDNAL